VHGFWDLGPQSFEFVVSDETIRELSDAGYPTEKRSKCLEAIATLPRLALCPEVIELAQYYVDEKVMPSYDPGDAFHLAFAVWYKIPYLVTWNCKHLANARKFEHIQVLTARKRLVPPMIVTPHQLVEIKL
jgi:predicted nucleic acid-binding protein